MRGEGVVGEQPHLMPGQGFRYSSGAVLETPVGAMQGSYQMLADDGVQFDAPIAAVHARDARHAALSRAVALYAIGDLQGCHAEFMALLERLRFDARPRPALAHRRPRQPRPGLARRAARGASARARGHVVLGNHDLHLLAMAFAPKTVRKRERDLEAVLDAPDPRSSWTGSRRVRCCIATTGSAGRSIHAGPAAAVDARRGRALRARSRAGASQGRRGIPRRHVRQRARPLDARSSRAWSACASPSTA